MKIVQTERRVIKIKLGIGFGISYFNNIKLHQASRHPHSQNPYLRLCECPIGAAGMKAAVSGFGWFFELFVMDESDLGFKTSERSGDDASWRNGTNILLGRGGVAGNDFWSDDMEVMGVMGCGA